MVESYSNNNEEYTGSNTSPRFIEKIKGTRHWEIRVNLFGTKFVTIGQAGQAGQKELDFPFERCPASTPKAIAMILMLKCLLLGCGSCSSDLI